MNISNQNFNTLFDEYQLDPVSTFFVIIDCEKCKTLYNLFREFNTAFEFPDYFSWNMNSFLEIMNDLSWLNKKDYMVVLRNSPMLLVDDFTETEDLQRILTKIKTEWSNVPNYEGEEKYRGKSRFILYYI